MTLAEATSGDPRWLIYCEGYHDRDFLSGLFEDALRFESLRENRGHPGLQQGKGVHGFLRGELVVSVRPSEGKDLARTFFAERLSTVASKRLAGLVLCVDEDDASSDADARKRAHDRIATVVDDADFDRATSTLRLTDGTEVRLLPITWCCADPSSGSLPHRQNLERLIVSACCEAYPDRGAAVETWLASRPTPPIDPSAHAKSYSWSHMAGWFPSPGGNEFFRALWRDDAIRAALAKRMSATGIDAVLAAMGVTPPWA